MLLEDKTPEVICSHCGHRFLVGTKEKKVNCLNCGKEINLEKTPINKENKMELREAIGRGKETIVAYQIDELVSYDKTLKFIEALQTLLDLAEKIEGISNSGLVVKELMKPLSYIPVSDVGNPKREVMGYIRGYGDCRQQQILLLAKNFTVERIERAMYVWTRKWWEESKKHQTQGFPKLEPKIRTRIAQVIHKELGG